MSTYQDDNPAPQTSQTAETENLPYRFDDDDLAQINSVEDAIALGEQVYGGPAASVADIIGTGFDQLKDDELNVLEGVRFYLLSWRFSDGDFGDGSEFVSAQVIVAKTGEKFIITGGGSGFYSQLKKITAATGQYGNLMVDRGLRTSHYKFCQACQRALLKREEKANRCVQCGSGSNVGPATTRYLDTSKGRST